MADGVVNLQVNAIGNFNSVIGEVGKLQSRLQALKLPKNLGTDAAKGLTDLEQKFTKFQNLASRGIKTKGDLNNFEKAAKEVDLAVRQVEKSLNSISNKRIKLNISDNDEIKKKVQELERFKKEAADAMNLKSLGTKDATGIFNISKISEIQKLFREGTAGAKNFQSVLNSFKSGNIDQVSTALQKLTSYAKQYEKTLNDSGGNQRGTQLLAWATEAQTAISGADAKIKEFNADIKQMRADQFNKMVSGVDALKTQFTGMSSSIRQTSQEMRNMAKSTMDTQSQLGMLQTQANYFFGLQNMFQLFKRNIQGTFDTVKQLDAAMTETAVVTDFSVSDMWSKLPLYTKTANELGATIKGAYETMTLYYQQGLNTEEAFSVGTETMKMARIAGLDYAQTTNMMTAALRGFNMEINSTSAKRVNDVYSELAAVTASDTRELGLAMERTASIAHSANMDFGNTTAFLAQMIETTREAPENLGTAMKTIIARFQELKDNPYQISEVEGEEVDFNRVDKALKSIGVDLMDNRDKFRDLDDVFMDISERWDGLSQTQQRYVATIAAGARQQSRFLAMVGNYDRLKQLTDAAANSEGASDVQFAKTLDSMEAKLNRLKNAWDQFAMGIANNKILKGFVDFGVTALDTVNKIETGIQDMFGGFDSIPGSIAKSITSLTALWAAFKVGGKIVDTSIGVLGNFLGISKVPGGTLFGGISGQRAANTAAQASAIYTPIVSAINNAAAVISNTTVKTYQGIKTSREVGLKPSYNDMRSAQQKMSNLGTTVNNQKDKYDTGFRVFQKTSNKQFDSTDAIKAMSGFEAAQQRVIYLQSSGTRQALERSFQQSVSKLDLSKEGVDTANNYYKALQKGIKQGTVTPEEAIRTAFNPNKLGQLIGGDVGKEISLSAKQQAQQYAREATKRGITSKEERKAYIANKFKDQQLVSLNKGEQTSNKISGITSSATAAGQAVMNLGMALDGLGLHGVGGTLASIGSTMTSFGLAASSAVSGVTALKTALAGMGVALGPLAAVTAAITAIGIAAGIAYKKHQDSIKEIRKEGKEVATTYNETIDSTTTNLAKLSDYTSEFAKLSKGVDVNGNNINLGTEEYSDYLKIVKEVTDMHPELIKGYNAKGNIIVDNNRLIKEAIKLEQQQQKEAKKTFISQESLDKMVAARETTKRWQVGQETIDRTAVNPHGNVQVQGTSQLKTDAEKVVQNIKQLENGNEILKDLEKTYHLTEGSFENLTTESLQAMNKYGGDMLTYIKSQAGEGSEELLDTINDSVAKVGKDFTGMEEVSGDIMDSLLLYAGEKGYTDRIHSTLQSTFTDAVKDIALFEKPENMLASVDKIGKDFSNLGGHVEEYKDILNTVEEAQTQFGRDLDLDSYNNTIDDSINKLEEWKSQWDKKTDSTSKALSEWAQNQIESFKNVSEGTIELSDAFNVMSGRVASANSAYESWTKANEGGDLYTGVENFKKMMDEVNDGVDDLGKGSNQWWTAAQSMFGDDYIFENSQEKIQSHMKQVSKYLEDGSSGIYTFMNDLSTSLDKELDSDILGLKKEDNKPYKISDFIDLTEDGELDFDKLGNAPDEAFSAIADALGLSDDLFTSLMNKARQFGDIKFGNVDQMRTALATSESTIAGNSFTADGNRNIYTRESDFKTQALQAGVRPNEIKEYISDLEKTGTIFLKGANEINKGQLSEYFKDWGISTGSYKTKKGEDRYQTTTDAMIKYFDKLGYSKDEIQQIYDTATSGNNSLLSDYQKVDFNESYEEAKAANADPGIQAATSIDGKVGSILGVVQSIAASMGILTGETKTSVEEGAKNTNEHATNLINGTGESYDKTKTLVEEDLASLKETKDQLEAGQSNYEEGSQKWIEFQSQIDKVNGSIALAEAALESVTQTEYETSQKRIQLQQQEAAAEEVVSQSTELSTAYNNTAIGEDNKLNTDNLNSLIESVKQTTDNEKTQSNVIGQYLQNSSKALVDQGASSKEIATSMQSAAQEMANNKMKPADIAAALNQGYGTKLTEKDVTTDQNGNVKLNLDQAALQEQLKNLQADVTANIVSIQTAASGQNNPNSAFHRVGTMARGSKRGYTIPGRPTLTGEDGEELVWEPKQNQAYMVGSNGPQFADISRDAVVWNAEQTRRIKKNSNTISRFGTGARGITRFGTMAGGSGGSGGSGGGGKKISGMLEVDATATIQEIVPPSVKPEIPVKAKLEVEGSTEGGFLDKIKSLFGKGQNNQSIDVTANVTSLITGEGAKTIKGVTASVSSITNESKNLKGIEATATVKKVVKSGAVAGEPVRVKATATVTKVDNKKNKDTKTTNTVTTQAKTTGESKVTKLGSAIQALRSRSVKIAADVSGSSQVNSLKNSINALHNKTVTVTYRQNGSPSKATGQNNYIQHQHVPKAGSAASGRYGQLGPNDRGGLTLTGEKGFEIAWIPSENRSLILGANGPQMINLPRDAVIWTNEQSKKILQQKAIPAGSHANPTGKFKLEKNGGSGGGKDKGKGKGKGKGGSDGSGGGNGNSKSKIKGGTVSSYIFNIEQKIAQVKKKQEALQKRINKQLEKTSVTLQAISGNGNQDLKRLRQLINLNGKLVTEYNKQLRVLDKTGKTTIKWTPKSKKGKKLKEKSKSINLGKYIYQDPDTGAYQVNYGKINKEIGKKDGEKAKAVKEAAEKAISDKTSKRDSAEAAADEAREKMAELGKQLYDTFHGWKNELTKIYDLTKRIEAAEQHTSRLKAAQELQEAKLSDNRNTATSEFIKTTLDYFKAELRSTADEMAKRNKAIEEQRIEVIRAISSKNELAEVQNATRAYNASKAGTTARVEAETRLAEARDKLNAIQTAQKYYSVTLSNNGTILNENFNATALAKDVNAGKISEKQYNLIKEYVDNVREQSQTLNDLLEEQSSSIKDLYESLGDLKEQYADRAKELLESVENADEENLDKLEKLNDALSDALKDLLDEIKRRLEQRRQQEDNLEKEEDISDKQRRLAALRADNSGANAKEIKQLEKEIADLQRDYGRTLEDQALDRLQDQADKAAEQRERQIQILNAQLDYAKNTGGNRLRVEALLADPEGNKAEIKELWRQNNKYYDALSQERDALDQKFNEFFTDISKDGLPAKIASTTTSIDKANTILSKIQSDVNKLIQDLNAPRTSSGQSSGGQSAVQMKREGMNLRAIVNGLRERGVAGKAFQNQVRKAGFGAKSFKSEGFSASQAKTYGGFSTKELRAGGYSAKEVKGTVKSVNELIRAGYGAKDLKAAGYKAKFLKSKGFNAKQLRIAGFTAKDLKAAGFTAPQLKAAGYSASQVIGAGYSTATLLKTGYTGAQIQKVNKTSTAAIQNAITKNIKNPNVTQSDLAGTGAKVDTNGKDKGGLKAGTVSTSGKRAVTRKGSTLYTQALDGKGKTTGKTTKIPITKLKTSHIKNYPKQAKEALIYAITHQTPGSVINEDMKALIKAAGMVGKTYKLKNKITASIGSNGKIYYNSNKKGVYIWDPSKKNSLKLDKYNKASFLKKAKKNNDFSREYAQVLIAKKAYTKAQLKKQGVKKFATGGLADYTGPAWLDGTPSKPELVLNSQDTKNFLALKDVLGKAVGSTQSVTNSNETAMYEININVDHINNDYDVDKIAERIKKDIVKDAGYRNVTQVRHFR